MNICRHLTHNGSLLATKSVSTMMKEFNERSLKRLCSTMPAESFDIEKEKKAFFEALPGVIEDLGKHPKFEELPIAKKWLEKVINGTVLGGKVSRGLTTVLAYKSVEKPENMTEETIRLARALGWCTELFQAYCVVLDDIVDGSLTRRGKPCWYRREDVGLANAVNDTCLIYYCLLKILQNYFENTPIYVKLYQVFNENLLFTSIGQFLDIRGSEFKKNHDIFTTENYEAIIKHKAAYYTYQLPISIGWILASYSSEESLRNCEELSFRIGKLFQIQDDYIDCFGDEFLTGKRGTDIQEGKCTWLAVNALPRCSAKHRAVFSSCYGSKEPAHIERIKQLYVQLQIPQFYKQQEREMYDGVIEKIKGISSAAERALFRKILDMTYDRKK